MRIIVMVKEVPDMDRVTFDRERGVINRASAQAEINPIDRNALQVAVEVKRSYVKQGMDCEIVALTMGPPSAAATLKDVYARGADRCILLTDRKFGGADTLATSRTLAAAVERLGEYDLILCGEKTVDGDTAQVGPGIAECLGIPHACYADDVKTDASTVTVTIPELCGVGQVREMHLPALVTVTKNAGVPELPTLKRKIEAYRSTIEQWSYEQLASVVDASAIGSAGSPTRVCKIEIPPDETRDSVRFEETMQFIHAVQEIIKPYLRTGEAEIT